MNGTDVFMINFGMPRLGDAAFFELFSAYVSNSTRVVHHHDIVPHLPPEDFGEKLFVVFFRCFFSFLGVPS
jgi:predicted lipase